MMIDLQKISLFVLLYFFTQVAFSCDVCSCGAANNSGFGSSLDGNYAGISYQLMHFNFKENTVVNNSPIGKDFVNTLALVAQYKLTDRIQINTAIPYRFNARNTSTDYVKNNGIGDVSIHSLYHLVRYKDKHLLKVGAGLKLPTGMFNLQGDIGFNGNQTSSIQLGTGSLDVYIPVQYQYNIKQHIAFRFNGVYFIKNKNSEDFKFGNQTQLAAQLSYAFRLPKSNSISTIAGVNYDYFLPTERFGIREERTSGFMTNLSLGVTANLSNYIVGANYQHPIYQNLIENEVSLQRGFGLFCYRKF